MNPFRADVFELCRSFVRTLLWLALAVNAAILTVFSVLLCFHLATFSWRYLLRTVFANEWGIDG